MDQRNLWLIRTTTTQNSCRSTRRASSTNKHECGCSQVKGKSKLQPKVLVGTTATIPMHERRWIDIEPSEQNFASYDLSKKVINVLRQNQTLQRTKDGAIEFCRIKLYLRNHHHSQVHNWSDDRWKVCLVAGGRNEEISISLIIRERFSMSDLFRDILGIASLILHYKTMC